MHMSLGDTNVGVRDSLVRGRVVVVLAAPQPTPPATALLCVLVPRLGTGTYMDHVPSMTQTR